MRPRQRQLAFIKLVQTQNDMSRHRFLIGAAMTSILWDGRKRIAVLVSLTLIGLATIGVLRLGESTVKDKGTNLVTISKDGTKIAFTKMGSGPALILVDGAFCYRENGPSAQLALLLARNFTVFTYDRRGRGESRDTAPYAIAREVEDLGSLVNEAGGAAFVVGISSGGALALQAVTSGVTITRLAMYEPPYIVENGIPRSYKAAKTHLEDLLSAGDRAGAVRFFLTEIYGAPRTFVYMMPLIMRSAWKRNESVAPTLSYDLTLLEDWTVLTDRRASIAIPTLVVGGEKSPQTLRVAVNTVTTALPNAHSQYLKGQNHNISAAAVAPVLVDFFQSEQSSRPTQ
jgi:pimeloyl-ACP methyl ester carboxylesterase